MTKKINGQLSIWLALTHLDTSTNLETPTRCETMIEHW